MSSDRPGIDRSFKRFVLLLSQVAGIAVCLISAVTYLVAHRHWFADLLCSFRVQYVLLLIVITGLVVSYRRWAPALVCAAFLVLNCVPLYDYLPFPVTKAESEHSIRVMVANVKTSNTNSEGIFDAIKKGQPDIVAVLELSHDHAEFLKDTASEFPYQYYQPRKHNFGMGILSRLPFKNVQVLEPDGLPSYLLEFELGGESCQLIATHPLPPMGEGHSDQRNQHLVEVADAFNCQANRIYMGDFNLTPWSPIFQSLLRNESLRDASKGFGVEPTWSLFPTYLGGVKIDHILVSENFSASVFEVIDIPGSDHRAVVAELNLFD